MLSGCFLIKAITLYIYFSNKIYTAVENKMDEKFDSFENKINLKL
jgi:hypothetical protein